MHPRVPSSMDAAMHLRYGNDYLRNEHHQAPCQLQMFGVCLLSTPRITHHLRYIPGLVFVMRATSALLATNVNCSDMIKHFGFKSAQTNHSTG